MKRKKLVFRSKGIKNVNGEGEDKLPLTQKYDVIAGRTYLIFEERNTIGFDLLFNVLTSKSSVEAGLCFTRENPERVKEKYALENTTFIWLSRNREINNIPPENIRTIAEIAEKFLSETKNRIIYIEGLEYLISTNGFDEVLRLLERLSDRAAMTNGVLVYSINPDILDERQKARIERFVTVLGA